MDISTKKEKQLILNSNTIQNLQRHKQGKELGCALLEYYILNQVAQKERLIKLQMRQYRQLHFDTEYEKWNPRDKENQKSMQKGKEAQLKDEPKCSVEIISQPKIKLQKILSNILDEAQNEEEEEQKENNDSDSSDSEHNAQDTSINQHIKLSRNNILDDSELNYHPQSMLAQQATLPQQSISKSNVHREGINQIPLGESPTCNLHNFVIKRDLSSQRDSKVQQIINKMLLISQSEAVAKRSCSLQIGNQLENVSINDYIQQPINHELESRQVTIKNVYSSNKRVMRQRSILYSKYGLSKELVPQVSQVNRFDSKYLYFKRDSGSQGVHSYRDIHKQINTSMHNQTIASQPRVNALRIIRQINNSLKCSPIKHAGSDLKISKKVILRGNIMKQIAMPT